MIVGPLTEAYLKYPEDRINGLAILELLKESLIEIVQSKPYAPIYVKASS